MDKKKLVIHWLFFKGVIISLLFVLLGFSHMFGVKKFWYSSDFNVMNLKRAINNTKNIDEFDDEGYTALMLASATGNKNIVKLLLKSGANPNILANTQIGDTALHSACQNGNVSVVSLLLNYYANPLMKNKNKETPLNRIINCENASDFYKIVNKFVFQGVDINYPDPEGRSLLFATVDQTKVPFLNILQKNFSYLINYNLKDKDGKNIKQFAVGIGDIAQEIKPTKLPVLYAGININAYNTKNSFNPNFNLTLVATIKGDYKYLEDGIKNHNANIKLKDKLLSNTPLHWACLYNWPNIVDLIVKFKANPNAKNKKGMRPIHCLWGIRAKENRKKVAKTLYKSGAKFNAQDNKGNTFLHRAVLLRDYDMVKLIVKDKFFNRRVNFNIKNKKKETAMDIAKKYKDKKIIDLLKNNYNISYLNKADKKQKFTPLMIAAMRGDLESGQKLIKQLNVKNINAQNKKLDTPLALAIRFRNIDFAKMLLGDERPIKTKTAKVANIDSKNKKLNTVLHEVVNIVNKKDRENMVKLLISRGADISENKDGETIMHLAVRNKMPDLISSIRKNLGLMAKNKKGKTPLDLAKQLGQTQDMKEIITLLKTKTTK